MDGMGLGIAAGSGRHTGTSRLRVEDAALLCGAGQFIDDLAEPANLAHAGILRSSKPVSYTHLDVYKRQDLFAAGGARVAFGQKRHTPRRRPVSYTHLAVYKRQARVCLC